MIPVGSLCVVVHTAPEKRRYLGAFTTVTRHWTDANGTPYNVIDLLSQYGAEQAGTDANLSVIRPPRTPVSIPSAEPSEASQKLREQMA